MQNTKSSGMHTMRSMYEGMSKRCDPLSVYGKIILLLLFKGEIYHENKWGESNWRMSGFGVLIWYWGLILYPFLTILFEYIENSEAKRAIIYGWGMFPIVFCLLRYRKARCDALMKHYDGKKHIGIIKLLFTPLALFVLEQWLFGKLGWTDSIW